MCGCKMDYNISFSGIYFQAEFILIVRKYVFFNKAFKFQFIKRGSRKIEKENIIYPNPNPTVGLLALVYINENIES